VCAALNVGRGTTANGAEERESPEATAAAAQETKEKPKLSEEAKLVGAIQAAHELVDFGRKEKAPEVLLTAARILGTVPIQRLKAETKEGSPIPDTDPQAALREQADKLITEARDMAQGFPREQRAAVEALAKTTSSLVDEQRRGVVGGPRGFPDTVGPNGQRFYTFDLYGGFTTVDVTNTFVAADLDLRVVGTLTGLEYARDTAPSSNARVGFSHLPIAKVTVIVTNCSGVAAPFFLTTN